MKNLLLVLCVFALAAPSYASTTLYNNSSSVGIGTTSPAGTLDVEGGTASSGNGANVVVNAQNGQASGNTNGGNIILMPGTANGTGTAGGVGIGTSSPAMPLELYGSGNGGYAVQISTPGTQSAQGSYVNYVSKADGSSLGSTATNKGWAVGTRGDAYTGQADLLIFSYWNGTMWNQAVNINSSGNVGIGTMTPEATLDVNGFARLALNSSAPATCSSTNKGAIALTHLAQACVCDTTPAWHTLNTSTACSW